MEPDLITFQSVDNDLHFDGTNFVLLTNREAIKDKLTQALRLRRGACLYDLDAGFPWEQLHGSTNPILYNSLIRNYLNSFPFIDKIVSLNVDFELETRSARIDFEIETTLGESIAVVFNTVI